MNKTRDTATAATLRANNKISGGGTITVNGSGSVLWSGRFIVISNGRGPHFTTNGYFDINCPTSGTITGVGGAANATATAAGVPIGGWQALYYIMPIGSTNASVAANFRIAGYTADSEIFHNWVLICHNNSDNGRFYFNNGIILSINQSINTATYDAFNSELLDSKTIGTSGNTVPLLDGTNTWSGQNTYTQNVTLSTSPFVRNIPTISSNYTVSPTYNEMSIGPITIGVGVSVIVQSGATWTIV